MTERADQTSQSPDDANPETEGSNAVLDIHELSFLYGDKRIVDVPELALKAGESLAVLGPSGCGKTTLLHLLAGLLKPAHGEIKVLDTELTGLSESDLDRFRGRQMGMVFQRLFLLPALSVRENVELAGRLARAEVASGVVDELLERLDIAQIAGQKPRTLSQGQAQRVAIARALVHKPRLLLADEPTSALDDERSEQVLGLLKEAVSVSGTSLLVVTHDHRVRGHLDREFEMERLH